MPASSSQVENRGQRIRLQHKQGRTWRTTQSKPLEAGRRRSQPTLHAGQLPAQEATVRIHTGRGTNRAGHLYLGSGRPIWNNDGDTATLIDPHNIAVSRYRY